jgi:hypothetical protein
MLNGIITEWPLVSPITVFTDTTSKTIATVMNMEHHQNFKNHFSQTILYSYNQYYGLIALTLVSNTVPHSQVHLSTRRALCSVSCSPNTQPLSLAHCYTHKLPHSSLQDLIPVLPSAPYIRLIAHREPSTRHWKIPLGHSLCRSHSSGIVWHCLCLSKALASGTMTSEASRALALQRGCCLMLQYRSCLNFHH